MIDEKTKERFLVELAKYGNVYVACAKIGIARATYYRWQKEDKNFRHSSNLALRDGRGNACDIAEYSVIQLAREKNLNASKYLLGHNSSRYRRAGNPSQVVIKHVRSESQSMPGSELPKGYTEMDFLDDLAWYRGHLDKQMEAAGYKPEELLDTIEILREHRGNKIGRR
ncbi:MAG TPA: hypothetical protein VJ553_04085 [Candidatus Paceibacterota bacterium]|nr:hypothetical protein [Candidatus Paceibacterota bacterium]